MTRSLAGCARPLLITGGLVVANGWSGTMFALEAGGALGGDALGLVLSAFNGGMLVGALAAAQLGGRVTPRGLAASGGLLAAGATAALPWAPEATWMLARFAQGFGALWIFAACEAWLGARPGTVRPIGFAVYLIVNQLGLAVGQLGTVASASTSFLACAALYASLLWLLPASERFFKSIERREGRSIAFVAPVSALLVAASSGVFVAAVLGPGALFAEARLPGSAAAFIACVALSGLLLQLPAAVLSRIYGPQRLLLVAAVVTMAVSLAFATSTAPSSAVMYAGAVALGASGFLFYPLAVGYALPRASESQLSRCSAELLLAYGVGGTVSPALAMRLGDVATGVPRALAVAGLLVLAAIAIEATVPRARRRLALVWRTR